MDKRFFSGLLLAFIISTTAVYLLETVEELGEESDMLKGSFFLVLTVVYIPVGVWAIRSDSNIAYSILIVGTVALMVFYAVTRTNMVQTIGIEAGSVGNLGILSKIFQAAIIILAGWMMRLNKEQEMIVSVKGGHVERSKKKY